MTRGVAQEPSRLLRRAACVRAARGKSHRTEALRDVGK